MAIEIELKAAVDEGELEGLKKRLFTLGVFLHSFEKRDIYFAFSPGAGFHLGHVRVRREKTEREGLESEAIFVTQKHKHIKAGIEVNKELEFSVSSGEVFEDFLRQIGMEPFLEKEKLGWAWRVPEPAAAAILAELLQVKPLGWFIELEILAQREEDVAGSRAHLLAFLAELGIPPEKIEARTYSQMLGEH
ncbi:MAG: CYTH domain-containing protein [Spirochaetes bacterium]|nr:CYTH domain-containing protein [Spirochaetota bacterium]